MREWTATIGAHFRRTQGCLLLRIPLPRTWVNGGGEPRSAAYGTGTLESPGPRRGRFFLVAPAQDAQRRDPRIVVGSSAKLAGGRETPRCGRSRLHKRSNVLVHPLDIKRQLVEDTSTSHLHLPLRTVGDEPPQMFQKLLHPLDPRVHDANVRL